MDTIIVEDVSKIITLTEQNFRREVLESPGPYLVEISAEWCGTSHIMAPVIEQLAAKYEGVIKFGNLDIDTQEEAAREFGVTTLPFLLLFKDGKLMDHLIGIISRKVLESRIKALL
jgi:thioredoxin 1